MLTGKVWPAHPHPLPGEILTSWIVRVAAANGVRLQPLCWMLFGNKRSPWNRDIDRNPPPWLIKTFSQQTGINYWDIFHTSLATYRGRLYPHRQATGQLRWILPVKHHGMQREAFGQQFCPDCLANDAIPYFRTQWRVALFTYCPIHGIQLHDACPACAQPVAIYRGDFARELKEARPMHVCHACGYDLRETRREQAFFPDEELRELFDSLLLSLSRPTNEAGWLDLGFYAVIHQFCRVMGARQNDGELQSFIAKRLEIPVMQIPLGRMGTEQRRRDERHQLLLCALWLMANLQARLEAAWLAKSMRYNLMLRDFDAPPGWYRRLVEMFSNWRRGTY